MILPGAGCVCPYICGCSREYIIMGMCGGYLRSRSKLVSSCIYPVTECLTTVQSCPHARCGLLAIEMAHFTAPNYVRLQLCFVLNFVKCLCMSRIDLSIYSRHG
jgi:hypothetical protein